MTQKQYELLIILKNSPCGKTIDDLLKATWFDNQQDFNLSFSEMYDNHWIYDTNKDVTKKYHITGIGKNELQKERIIRNTYRLTIVTAITSIAALITSAAALVISLMR